MRTDRERAVMIAVAKISPAGQSSLCVQRHPQSNREASRVISPHAATPAMLFGCIYFAGRRPVAMRSALITNIANISAKVINTTLQSTISRSCSVQQTIPATIVRRASITHSSACPRLTVLSPDQRHVVTVQAANMSNGVQR